MKKFSQKFKWLNKYTVVFYLRLDQPTEAALAGLDPCRGCPVIRRRHRVTDDSARLRTYPRTLGTPRDCSVPLTAAVHVRTSSDARQCHTEATPSHSVSPPWRRRRHRVIRHSTVRDISAWNKSVQILQLILIFQLKNH